MGSSRVGFGEAQFLSVCLFSLVKWMHRSSMDTSKETGLASCCSDFLSFQAFTPAIESRVSLIRMTRHLVKATFSSSNRVRATRSRTARLLLEKQAGTAELQLLMR